METRNDTNEITVINKGIVKIVAINTTASNKLFDVTHQILPQFRRSLWFGLGGDRRRGPWRVWNEDTIATNIGCIIRHLVSILERAIVIIIDLTEGKSPQTVLKVNDDGL